MGESNSQAVDSKSTRYASSRQRRKNGESGFEPGTRVGETSSEQSVLSDQLFQTLQLASVDLEGFEPSAVSGPLSAFTNVIPIKPNAVRGCPNYGVPNCCQNVGRHPLASDGDSYG